jgi:hypothetical protein
MIEAEVAVSDDKESCEPSLSDEGKLGGATKFASFAPMLFFRTTLLLAFRSWVADFQKLCLAERPELNSLL